MLSPENSAEPGRWRTSRAEYTRGFMDAFSEPDVTDVVGVFAGQTAKTECLNNVLGYFIHQEPAPIIFAHPTERMARYWSKDRLAPMLRDSPALRGLVQEARARKSGSEILEKKFPGGGLAIIGANAPSGLASRPRRVALGDEVDRWPRSAGTEGDPVGLLRVRTSNFWNRIHGWISTPTLKHASRIWDLWESSDQRYFWVPCLSCGEVQVLRWAQVQWDGDDPTTARYECEQCQHAWDDSWIDEAVGQGRWIASRPFAGIAGFHLWALYSPWIALAELVGEWLQAQGDDEKLKVFVNTKLAELWEEDSEAPPELDSRTEAYPAPIPAGGLVVTMGVDLQGGAERRAEVSRYAWGEGRECWAIDHHVLDADPRDLLSGRDPRLEELLTEAIEHESGLKLRVSACCVDSGDGEYTDDVYAFARRWRRRRVYATKGKAGDREFWPLRHSRSKRALKAGADLRIVGVDKGKREFLGATRRTTLGPGYLHFPDRPEFDAEFFAQLRAERCVAKKRLGVTYFEWVQDYVRNEALDCWILARAALSSLSPKWPRLAAAMRKAVAARKDPGAEETQPEPEASEPEPEREGGDGEEPEPTPPAPRPERGRRRRRKRGGFVRGW